jgi:hypothetical protein
LEIIKQLREGRTTIELLGLEGISDAERTSESE